MSSNMEMPSNMEYSTSRIVDNSDYTNAMKNATMGSANEMLKTGLASVGKNWDDIKIQLNNFQKCYR